MRRSANVALTPNVYGLDVVDMKTAIEVNREDIRQVVAEEQFNFTRDILTQMGLPLTDCYPESGELADFTLDHKIKLRQVLGKFGIVLLDDRDGGIEIYIEKPSTPPHLVAKWNKCRYELREDLTTKDPRHKKIYAVIYVDYWSEYEKQE
jgi:hypothetical protein